MYKRKPNAGFKALQRALTHILTSKSESTT